MALPKKYNLASEGAVATYNYTDIDEGVGYVIYYLAQGTDESMITAQSGIASNGVVHSSFSQDTVAWNTIHDDDYDITFNTPKTIKGKVLASFTQGVNAVTAGETSYSRVTVKIRKWDGANETELANNVSDEIDEDGAAIKSVTELVEVDVPETLFKSGETLRITVFQEGKNQDATCDSSIGYGHDPADRADDHAVSGDRQVINAADTTKFEVHVPYKLQL